MDDEVRFSFFVCSVIRLIFLCVNLQINNLKINGNNINCQNAEK